MVIADVGWKTYGMAAEIAVIVFENAFDHIKSPPIRITLPDTPAPASSILEKVYYPTTKDIVLAIKKCLKITSNNRIYKFYS